MTLETRIRAQLAVDAAGLHLHLSHQQLDHLAHGVAALVDPPRQPAKALPVPKRAPVRLAFPEQPPRGSLRPAESALLKLLAEGATGPTHPVIAARLGCDLEQVRPRILVLFQVLGVDSVRQAVAVGRQRGFLPEPAPRAAK